MFLYSLTLQKSSSIDIAIYGSFSAPKAQEIVVSTGRCLELLRPDENGRVQTVLSSDVFGEIRSLRAVRLTGGNVDFIVVGSDSGRIVILSFNALANRFDKVHQETFGRSGCRRIVPGQYLASDAQGRAVMIAAVERQKFVYVLNRDAAAKLTISSPLEAHKSNTLVWAAAGLDVGFENPMFACLEVDHDEPAPTKTLTYYELDLGLNHVVRKAVEPVDESAHALVAVPGDRDGPGGVLVCCENRVLFRNVEHAELTATLPRRGDEPLEQSLMVVAHATHKQKDMFFVLLQSERGDLYKVTLDYKNDVATQLHVHYFDTIPLAADIAVLKNGFLFVALAQGGNQLYQFQGLGAADDSLYRKSGAHRVFEAREPVNLALIHSSESLAPTIECVAADWANEGSAQLYALTGTGSSAALRVLRHGLAVDEVAVAPLEANPIAVWTVKRSASDAYDAYLVVSFVNATLVLSIGGETVEEVADSGLLGTTPTLLAASIGDSALLQAHADGLRVVQSSDKRVQEWAAPGRKKVQHAACNGQQAVVALSGGELFYFELDELGQLQEIGRVELGKELSCVDLAPLSENERRARFLAVGDWDNTVQVFSLERDSLFSQLATQVLPAQASALAIVEMQHGATTQMYLNIGLKNGVLLRTALDDVSGELSDTRTRFVGSKAVQLHRVRVHGAQALVALSSRSWLCYNWHARYHMTPLTYQRLEYASSFASEQCPEGIVAVADNTVRIVALERLGDTFNEAVMPLRYTPRKFALIPESGERRLLALIEAEIGTVSMTQRGAAAQRKRKGQQSAGDADAFDVARALQHERQFGRARAADRQQWASCVRVLDALSGETLSLLELDNNECAVSVAAVPFASRADAPPMIVVGTVQDLQLAPRKLTAAFLRVYEQRELGQLTLLHKTQIEDVPGALALFDGRLLAGVGSILRIYELGKKQLLRKCENRNFPSHIVRLDVTGTRVVVGDLAKSFLFVAYKRVENQFHIFADDPLPRWLTAGCRVDYDTMAGGDKFGNVFVNRLPDKVSETIDDDPTGGRHRWEQGALNGAPHKTESVVEFHVGQTLTSINKTPLVTGGAEMLLYTTVGGAVGALLPFVSKTDVDFFQHLEMHMRQAAPPLAGRDHQAYRSAYFPVKNCVDGDLCEQYFALSDAQQQSIATEMDRPVAEIIAKLENLRASVH